MRKKYDYVEHGNKSSDTSVFKIDGHVIDQISYVSTHTLNRWLRKAKKHLKTWDSDYLCSALANDVIRTLEKKP